MPNIHISKLNYAKHTQEGAGMNYMRNCIFQLIAEKGLSQREVAISLGCSESQLSKFLHKEMPFPKKKIHKIFEVCEIDIGEEKDISRS